MQALQVAILCANGFSEKIYGAVQKAALDSSMSLSLIGYDGALIQSWSDGDWGLSYPADAQLSASIASDYDVLVLPGSAMMVKQLGKTAHTPRFINGFVNNNKLVFAFDEAKDLIENMTENCYAYLSDDQNLADNIQAMMNILQDCFAAKEAA